MKKLILFNPGSGLYGAEQGMLNILKALRDDYAITVVLPERGPVEQMIRETAPSTEIIRFPLALFRRSFSPLYYLSLPFIFLTGIIYFQRYIRRRKIDIICTNSLLIMFPAIIAAVTGKKHIWYIREMFSSKRLNKLCSRLLRDIPGKIICVSVAIKESLFLPENIPVIYDPIDSQRHTRFDTGRARKELSLPLSATIISCISRIHPSKGQYELLISLYPALKTRPDVLMLFVGDISLGTLRVRRYRKKIKTFIRTHSLDNVLFWGLRRDIDKILSASDICVFPFRRAEPFGIAIAEALSFGKTTFFPRCGGTKEIAAIFRRGEEFSIDDIMTALDRPRKDTAAAEELYIPEELSFSRYAEEIRSIFHDR